MSDDEQPPAKPTVALEAVPAWAIELSRNVTIIRGNVELMSGDMVTMKSDIRGLKQWRLEIEAGGSVPPIPPMTSTGVRALIDGHPSAMDLEQQSKLAAVIVEQEQLKTAIVDTHAIALASAEVLKKQSDYMGMGREGIKWLISKDNRTTLAQIAAALVFFYEALRHGGVVK